MNINVSYVRRREKEEKKIESQHKFAIVIKLFPWFPVPLRIFSHYYWNNTEIVAKFFSPSFLITIVIIINIDGDTALRQRDTIGVKLCDIKVSSIWLLSIVFSGGAFSFQTGRSRLSGVFSALYGELNHELVQF